MTDSQTNSQSLPIPKNNPLQPTISKSDNVGTDEHDEDEPDEFFRTPDPIEVPGREGEEDQGRDVL